MAIKKFTASSAKSRVHTSRSVDGSNKPAASGHQHGDREVIVTEVVEAPALYRALDSKGIAYEVYDLTEDADALEHVRKLGYLLTPAISQRVANVTAALGSNAKLATLLGISASQPTRWIQGDEAPNPENARAIVDLDYVVARAGLVWLPEVVTEWLYGHNSFLGGARPIDVLKTQGSADVVDALDQELSGAYA